MAGYVTADQVAAALPGLNINGSVDVSTTAINTEIETVARKMRERRGHYFTNPLTDHQSDLCAFVNQFLPAARIALRRATDIGPELVRYARAQQTIGEALLTDFCNGQYRISFQRSSPIPRVSLATVTECCAYVADFVPTSRYLEDEETDNPEKSYPWQEQIELWIRWASAAVYSAGALRGYDVPADTDDLTADQLETYSAPVREIVGSQIVRVQKAQNKRAGINVEADELLRSGFDNLTAIRAGRASITFRS